MENDNKKIILCIDDNKEILDLINLVLTRRDFEILNARDSKEGLQILIETKPDLILLDLMLPDMDGWDLLQKIKSMDRTKEIPVIVISAKAQNIDKVLGIQIAKVDNYLSKPFTPRELIASIESVFKRNS